MENPLVLTLFFLLIGMVLGAALGWFWARFRLQPQMIPRSELARQFVSRELFDNLQNQADLLLEDNREKDQEIRQQVASLAASRQQLANLEEKLQRHEQEEQARQERSRLEFENLANRLLEEKSRKFTDQNKQQISDLLLPLKEKIQLFEEGIEKRFLEETKDRISLQKEIEHLRLLNQQLSEDANNLASALKGGNKTQGDWGELQLELLLEKAGLVKGLHYQLQHSFRDEGGRQKRPDFIVHLPDDKQLVIDSKVSLVAYERYFNESKPEKRDTYLRQHIDSLRNHLKDLSGKNYQQLYQINSPDYILLFVPVEPALGVALQQDPRLFVDALDQNIVIVTTSTLLATMRTVSYIWKQEKQKRNVLEIARQSGLLYDKFCGFVDDLNAIGQRLEQAQGAYHDAMQKLANGKRYGDTLIGRAEKIRELGAKASKNLPRDLLDTAEDGQ